MHTKKKIPKCIPLTYTHLFIYSYIHSFQEINNPINELN